MRVCFAHFVGLTVVGLYGTIGTTAGFGSGAGWGTFAGAIISVPWFAVLALVIWFYADWIERHILFFCMVGPPIVCGSWFVLDGRDLLDAVAISSVTSSIVFASWTGFRRIRKRIEA